ncbi:undecaprenyldiphospho-muramoylpentapeptide beta-N-acetylglucosaminyltransferase [Macrococcus armenti]|uniref:undecaprenyldiphospho-muramoylpentapeptide beta-N-acetylglucosaminyltransferase n=1 Tax=Macrococcus armenti TaxID=2875764 RepID=UPI001CCF3FD3|nr:undecaprenyldiphospho-muramoylpentapeptide beta-N-acetylglucosaminyltransferase [Macrococcus armenti]UBH14249.1 undecaprenyldiphospho-muramoylpentapeptide beta-N-acetylglucosaminyltransferase [Macrococcus armenti]
MVKIAFTGGGTIGHVAVNMAIIPEAQRENITCIYIGSKNGIEQEVITKQFPDVKYYSISSGKLRRYISVENVKDVFKVQKGVLDALKILKKEKPDLVFSKGGFVAVPVTIAAKILNIKTIIHESDVTPGLANKIALKFAHKMYTTFEKTLDYIPDGSGDYVGSIIRNELFAGNKQQGYALTQFNSNKPVLLIMGGSLGSKVINDIIFNHIDELLHSYQIIHLVGKGNRNQIKKEGYYQLEYAGEELMHLFKITDYVISRAGSNAIFEFLALKKPMILVPLGKDQSRGDQIDNAAQFKSQGYASVIDEPLFSYATLTKQLDYIKNHQHEILQAMNSMTTRYTAHELLNKIIQDAK